MNTIMNQDQEVLTRYIIKKIPGKEWDNHYSQIRPYKLMSVEKTSTGKVISCNIIFRVALTKEWLKEKEDSGIGFRCLFCKDTGLTRDSRDYCKCQLGQGTLKHFGNTTNIKKDE